MPIVALLVVALGCVPRSGDDAASMRFVDVAAQVGLDGAGAPRLCVADVDADGRPDLVLDRTRVMLNRAANADAGGGSAPSPPGFLFLEVESRLEHPGVDGVSIFADLDGDAIPDAIVVRSRGAAAWQRGRGDGSFDDAAPLEGARPGTVAAIAAGDADRDGRTDLFVTHWYRAYGERLDADPADLLLQRRDESGAIRFERHPLPEDDAEFDEERDAGGRPIYGALIAQLVDASEAPPPQLIELAYGRRWNRLYARRAPAADGASSEREWVDRAPALGFDGDEDRSGTYPPWLRERAATDPRFDRTDEKPFRSNGNTFDASIGDLDGDGRFDAVLAEITHAWAGPSSDRSRVLVRRGDRFESPPEWSLDRIPSDDSDQARRWNQGDLFVELADFDLDGRLDLALASGDYPDPPPFDERLRILLQRSEGDAAAPSDGPRDANAGTRARAAGESSAPTVPGSRWLDATAALGVDLPGCAQIALADFDLDGRMDLVAGQSFTRFTPAMIEAAGGTPRVKLYLNRAVPSTASAANGAPAPSGSAAAPACVPRSIELLLRGDPSRGIAAIPLGAIVEIEPIADEPARGSQAAAARVPPRMIRQLVGPGGHSGKQSEAIIHAGLGAAHGARVRITWPSEPPLVSPWITRSHGRHALRPHAPSPDD